MPSHQRKPRRSFELPCSIRQELKEPLGKLLPEKQVTKSRVLKEISELHTSADIAAVGDRTTERLEAFGLLPRLEVIDRMERRQKKRRSPRWPARGILLRASNESGVLSKDALAVLQKAFEALREPAQRVRVLVQGEEDLLALPILAFYPKRILVFYGQPGEGLVLADSKRVRSKCRKYLQSMGIATL